MATDYDAPRASAEDEQDTDSLERLKSERGVVNTDLPADEANLLEDLELPGADLSDHELSVRVVPIQRDEFTCPSCFLVMHASRRQPSGRCSDCD